MRTAAIAVVALLGACGTMQSARVLPTGKTQVSVGVARNSLSSGGKAEPLWLGEVELRHGVSDAVELGVSVDRSAGARSTISAFGVVPKIKLASNATTALALAVPVSLVWEETGSDVANGSFMIFPTLLAGLDLSPGAELVFAPRAGVFLPSGASASLYGIGGSIGLNIGDRAKGGAIHPEAAVLVVQSLSDGGGSETLFTLGLSVTAGN
jgi:hypothetical protein